MAKKKTPSKSKSPVQNDLLIKNGLGNALGFGSFDPFGLPFGGGLGFPGTEQLSNTNTTFKNLRWYLVSNFRQVLSQLYVEIGLVQTIVDLPVDDALRGGIEIHSKELDEDETKQLQVSLDRDNDLMTAGQAAKWNRLFGGAGILILTDQDPEEEFDISVIGEDEPLEFRAVDMWELFWDKQNTEGFDPSIQTHNFEHYSYYGIKVHKSRVMRMKGIEAPSFIRPRLRGWGFSVCEKLIRSMNQWLKSNDLIFEVLDEFKVDVYKVKNLVNTLLSPNGDAKIKQRIQMANWQKNYQNAVVMDSEDDWDHKQLSFAGLAEAQAGIRKHVAADMRMPATKLFGSTESGGLGNADQNDMENYNAMVESEVRNKLKYHLLRICEIKCQKLFGLIPDDLEIKFKPLRVLSAVDEETVKTQKFTRLAQAKASGEITTYEFREGCNKGNLFDITLDNAGDLLNPNDPQVADLVVEGNDPTKIKDTDDPGANRSDTQKSKLFPKGEYGGKKGESESKVKNSLPKVPPYPKQANTLMFDRKSYEADGGDAWIDSRRKYFFDNPVGVDQALWAQAKDRSRLVFGQEKWQFTVWYYKKLGGSFQ